ncbi:putative histone-lysine N-methyltransferase 1 isoform X1 [Hydra vulgaris]|uniref:putative histone-lysine N-methyltransferase 1 isoform X1 n=1 Tax=Hydra vulgaris TaxID=6087 RepID=UPI0006412597|nr:putative histone-lysine N-methyltransferase 1 [Hydra vulgaris]
MSGVGDIRKQIEKNLNLTPSKLDDKLKFNKTGSVTVPKKTFRNNQKDLLNELNSITKSSNNLRDHSEKLTEKPTPQKKPVIPPKKPSEQDLFTSKDGNILPFSKHLKPAVVSKPCSLSNASSFSESQVLSNSTTFTEQNMKNLIINKPRTQLANGVKNTSDIINIKCTNKNINFSENNEAYDDVNEMRFCKVKCDNIVQNNIEVYDDVLQASDCKDMNQNKDEDIEIYDDVNDSNIFNNKVRTSENIIQEDMEIYDDIINPILCNHSNQVESIGNVVTDEEIYDDVNNPVVSTLSTLSTNTVPVNDEIYDDVNNPVESSIVQPMCDHEDIEIYDDVSDQNLSINKVEPLANDSQEVYDDVSNNTSQAPAKCLKSFSSVDQSLFNAPNGLEVWLKKLLDENHYRIKNVTDMSLQMMQAKVKSTDIKNDRNACGNDSFRRGIFPCQAEKDIAQGIVQEKILPGEKDDKKNDREELRLRKKSEKKEKEKEKAERKKKIKEYKLFGLDPDKELISIGEFVCKSTYSSKKKDSLDLSFQYGDEVNLIEFPRAPSGKVLTKRVSDGKLGYILKSELGIPEEESEKSMERPRCQSLIPTEDEIEGPEVYEVVVEAAPPIPIRPRPQIQFEGLRNTQREELMRLDAQKAISNNNDQEDELYQEL